MLVKKVAVGIWRQIEIFRFDSVWKKKTNLFIYLFIYLFVSKIKYISHMITNRKTDGSPGHWQWPKH